MTTVRFKTLLPALSEAIGGRDIELEFEGETLHDLLEHLTSQYGPKAREALLEGQGQLASVIQVLLNGKEWVPHDKFDKTLHDGDEVTFIVMFAGG